MGWYGDRVLPRIIDVACGMKVVVPLRQRVCEQLHGRVLEVGFGSCLYVPYYPAAVTMVESSNPPMLPGSSPASASRRAACRCDGPHSTGSSGRTTRTASTPRCPPGRRAPSPCRAARGATSSPPGRHAALRRARPGTRRGRTALAAPLGADAEAALRRVPPHPARRGPAHSRKLHRHRTRRLLREGSTQGPERALPRHCGARLTGFRVPPRRPGPPTLAVGCTPGVLEKITVSDPCRRAVDGGATGRAPAPAVRGAAQPVGRAGVGHRASARYRAATARPPVPGRLPLTALTLMVNLVSCAVASAARRQPDRPAARRSSGHRHDPGFHSLRQLSAFALVGQGSACLQAYSVGPAALGTGRSGVSEHPPARFVRRRAAPWRCTPRQTGSLSNTRSVPRLPR